METEGDLFGMGTIYNLGQKNIKDHIREFIRRHYKHAKSHEDDIETQEKLESKLAAIHTKEKANLQKSIHQVAFGRRGKNPTPSTSGGTRAALAKYKAKPQAKLTPKKPSNNKNKGVSEKVAKIDDEAEVVDLVGDTMDMEDDYESVDEGDSFINDESEEETVAPKKTVKKVVLESEEEEDDDDEAVEPVIKKKQVIKIVKKATGKKREASDESDDGVNKKRRVVEVDHSARNQLNIPDFRARLPGNYSMRLTEFNGEMYFSLRKFTGKNQDVVGGGVTLPFSYWPVIVASFEDLKAHIARHQ